MINFREYLLEKKLDSQAIVDKLEEEKQMSRFIITLTEDAHINNVVSDLKTQGIIVERFFVRSNTIVVSDIKIDQVKNKSILSIEPERTLTIK